MTDGQLAGFAAQEATNGRVDNGEAAQPVDQEATNRHIAQGAVNGDVRPQPAIPETIPPRADRKGQVKGAKLSFLTW